MSRRGILAALLALASLGSITPVALADTSLPFTPAVQVSTSDPAGGAHPNLVLRMTKTPNGCPGGGKNCANPYLEQDLKRWVITLPEGMMADPQATPKCDDPQIEAANGFQYSCPVASQVGELVGKTRGCKPAWCSGEDSFAIKGAIYNGKPKAGEQGHLYTLVGTVGANGSYSKWVRIDSSIVVRTPEMRIEATTDQIPDYMPYPNGSVIPLQPYDIAMTLWGAAGASGGHPLLTNATFCQPRQLDSLFQGYADFAYQDADNNTHTGTGAGTAVGAAAVYPLSACNQLAYEPQIDFAISDAAAGAAPAIETAISQAVGEQTTGKVRVRIPPAFKVNMATKVAPCPPEQMAADSCPASSRVGTAQADSPLLPDGPLSGEVFVGQPTATQVPMHVSLGGFVELALDGSLTLGADGAASATFAAPAVPVSRFAMRLEGGAERGLLLNPARCGPQTVTTTFESHQGKLAQRNSPIQISCGAPALEATVDPARPKARPSIVLRTAGATGIDDLSFTLPRALKLRKAASLHWRKSYGTVSLATTKGKVEADLILVGASSKALTFAVADSGTTLARATLSLRRTRTLSFSDLPADLVTLGLELAGDIDHWLRTSSTCRKRLRFSTRITDPLGAVHTPERTVKLKCRSKALKKGGKGTGARRKGAANGGEA